MALLGLTSLAFSDGTEIAVDPGSIVVLVGPNNTGKSRALREIHAQLIGPGGEPSLVVPEASFAKYVDGAAASEWLRQHSDKVVRGGQEVIARPFAGELAMVSVEGMWAGGPPFQGLGPFFCLFANTENRLQLTGSVGAVDALAQPATAPLQVLYLREDLEDSLAKAADRAFGHRVAVNRVAGATIHLHVGAVTGKGLPVPTNAAYREAIGALPLVQGEGDGVRSYVGVLLSVLAAQYPLVLIDEPEAFLHPPQARQLGRELRGLVEAETQLVVATHSADFLQGVLDSPGAPVTVVRLTRTADINHAAVLSAQELGELWSDPILRYSGLLDGVFHAGVVLCEGDADCRFYEATLDAALARQERRAADLLFTHTGGKHRLPAAIRAMAAIGVATRVVADMDVLSEGGLLRRIVEALGGDWSSIERDWEVTRSAVQQLGSAPPLLAVKDEMRTVLNDLEGPKLTPEMAQTLREVVTIEDGWARAKRSGISALPQGDASKSGERLFETLKDIGLHVVPVGELERWATDVPRHGPRWVAGALEAEVHESEGPHSEFVLELLAATQADPAA